MLRVRKGWRQITSKNVFRAAFRLVQCLPEDLGLEQQTYCPNLVNFRWWVQSRRLRHLETVCWVASRHRSKHFLPAWASSSVSR